MIGITKENINSGVLSDKKWEYPKKFGFKNKISTNSKIVLYLLGTFIIFSLANSLLIYNFYKLLIKM